MSYAALATDYDGTIAHDGIVGATTLLALRRLRAAGWRLILATGRELSDLQTLMPDLSLFDRVIAENGAVLHSPETGSVRLLAGAPPDALAAALASKGVSPLHQAQVVLETWQEHEATVRATIQELDLPLSVVNNKGALMVLPEGITKGTGTAQALRDLGIQPAHCVGVGDAENDLDLFALCGLGVAVQSALPTVKQAAGLVLQSAGGEGIAELVGRLLSESTPVGCES